MVELTPRISYLMPRNQHQPCTPCKQLDGMTETTVREENRHTIRYGNLNRLVAADGLNNTAD